MKLRLVKCPLPSVQYCRRLQCDRCTSGPPRYKEAVPAAQWSTAPPAQGYTSILLLWKNLCYVIREMKSDGYSIVPVYISQTLVGVINRKMVVEGIGRFIEENKDIDDAIKEPVAQCLNIFDETNHYEVAPATITVENLLYMFQQNRKLSSVILTENGNFDEPAKAVLVSADLIDLNTILDNY